MLQDTNGWFIPPLTYTVMFLQYVGTQLTCLHDTSSLAVEGFDPEEIGIEMILVSKEADFFVEQHIQNPPKSALGKSH